MAEFHFHITEGASLEDYHALREEMYRMSDATQDTIAAIRSEVTTLNTNLTAAQALLDEKQAAIAAGIAALVAKLQNTFPIDTEMQMLLDSIKEVNERTVMLIEDIATTETGEEVAGDTPVVE